MTNLLVDPEKQEVDSMNKRFAASEESSFTDMLRAIDMAKQNIATLQLIFLAVS